ncbi:MAG: hypothetical protein KDA99_18195, partial [Planctomycetales bacterium]|nr:hypothetical protein [Planctomycetales bacterium]
MSHRLHSSRVIGSLPLAVATIAVLLLSDVATTTRAQGVGQTYASDLPYSVSSSGQMDFFGTTPFRLWHQTAGYGQNASQTMFGGRGAMPVGNGLSFIDAQVKITNERALGANIGTGFRWMQAGFGGSPRILGVSGWYDGEESVLENYFNQVGVSVESLGDRIDFRLNAQFPISENSKTGGAVTLTDEIVFDDVFLSQKTLTPVDLTYRVIDFEAAARIMETNAWFYGGGYQVDGTDVSTL